MNFRFQHWNPESDPNGYASKNAYWERAAYFQQLEREKTAAALKSKDRTVAMAGIFSPENEQMVAFIDSLPELPSAPKSQHEIDIEEIHVLLDKMHQSICAVADKCNLSRNALQADINYANIKAEWLRRARDGRKDVDPYHRFLWDSMLDMETRRERRY